MDSKISVVIPLYNKQEAIESTLCSVLSQTIEPIEIIVVDDGSTDESVNIVRTIKSEKISLVQKSNGGVSSARNVGMMMAKGDWIFLLDADDTLEPKALEIFSKMIITHPTEKIFIGNYWGREHSPYRCRVFQDFCRVADNSYKAFLFDYLAPKIGAFIFHKSIIADVGMFDERMSFFEDFDFTCRIMDRYAFVYSSLPVMSYRQEFSTLSLPHHPIEKEFAFYLDKQHLCNAGIWKELIIAENLRYCEYVRSLISDVRGVNLYKQKYKDLFSWRCHLVFFIIDFGKRINRRCHILSNIFHRQ